MKTLITLACISGVLFWSIFYGGDYIENHTDLGRKRNIEITTAFVKKVASQETLTRRDIESVPRDVKYRDSIIDSVAAETGLSKATVLQYLDEGNIYFVAKTRSL